MKTMKVSKWFSLFMAVLFAGVLTVACDDSSDNKDNNDKAFEPTNIVSLQALVSITPDATLDRRNVTELFKNLDAVTKAANTIKLDCMDIMMLYMFPCMGAGSADVQFCSEDPLSYDVVFDGCMADPDNGIDSGTMTVDNYKNSKDFFSLTYANMVYIYMGAPMPPVTAMMDVYAFKSGKVIGFLQVAPGVFLVMGMNPDGATVCNFMAPATVMVDFTNNLWTSDGGCGLPVGPIEW